MTLDHDSITLPGLRRRHAALSDKVVRTPLVRLMAPELRPVLGEGELYLKLECHQATATFKARGALSAMAAIPADRARFGVTAASAGNHAVAVAWAARRLGLDAKVVMQSSASPLRVARARAEGAEIVIRDGGPATFAEAERLQAEEGRTFIHPFEGINTTMGAAGVGLEIVEDLPDVDSIFVSVGGGGLISGVAAAAGLARPECRVFGIEPSGADAVSRGLASGGPVTLSQVQTVADSLGPPMSLPFSLSVIGRYVDEVVTIPDAGICAGVVALQQLANLEVEPAAGAAMAGALGPFRDRLRDRKSVVVVCGSNLDPAGYARIHAAGMDGYGALLG